jgi:hypothetical protein
MLFVKAVSIYSAGVITQGRRIGSENYIAHAVKNCNSTSSLVRFENKNILLCFEKRSSLLPTTLALWLQIPNS